MRETNSQTCSCAGEVATYLDGELIASAENSFESHLIECAECAEQLNTQKRLLCALDVAFGDEKNFDVPVNFAKLIAVRAESDVTGLRSRDERRTALIITIGLISFVLMVGIAGKQSGILTLVTEKLLSRIWVVAGVLGDFCYDLGVGVNVILRVVNRHFIAESPFVNLLLTILLVVAFVILSRLLFKFHRIEQSG